MHGVVEDDFAASEVRQPTNAAAMTMAMNAAGKGRSIAFIYSETALIKTEGNCPVNHLIPLRLAGSVPSFLQPHWWPTVSRAVPGAAGNGRRESRVPTPTWNPPSG